MIFIICLACIESIKMFSAGVGGSICPGHHWESLWRSPSALVDPAVGWGSEYSLSVSNPIDTFGVSFSDLGVFGASDLMSRFMLRLIKSWPRYCKYSALGKLLKFTKVSRAVKKFVVLRCFARWRPSRSSIRAPACLCSITIATYHYGQQGRHVGRSTSVQT